MSKHKTPQQLVVARNGEKYRLIVMRVTETDDDKPKINGLEFPRELYVIDDNEAAEIQGGEHFITCYVPVSVFGMPPTEGK